MEQNRPLTNPIQASAEPIKQAQVSIEDGLLLHLPQKSPIKTTNTEGSKIQISDRVCALTAALPDLC
jgi:hypothetical protein